MTVGMGMELGCRLLHNPITLLPKRTWVHHFLCIVNNTNIFCCQLVLEHMRHLSYHWHWFVTFAVMNFLCPLGCPSWTGRAASFSWMSCYDWYCGTTIQVVKYDQVCCTKAGHEHLKVNIARFLHKRQRPGVFKHGKKWLVNVCHWSMACFIFMILLQSVTQQWKKVEGKIDKKMCKWLYVILLSWFKLQVAVYGGKCQVANWTATFFERDMEVHGVIFVYCFAILQWSLWDI